MGPEHLWEGRGGHWPRGGELNTPIPSPCQPDSKNDDLGDKMKEFMHKYDKNADGKIEMAEVSGAGPAHPQDAHVPP